MRRYWTLFLRYLPLSNLVILAALALLVTMGVVSPDAITTLARYPRWQVFAGVLLLMLATSLALTLLHFLAELAIWFTFRDRRN